MNTAEIKSEKDKHLILSFGKYSTYQRIRSVLLACTYTSLLIWILAKKIVGIDFLGWGNLWLILVGILISLTFIVFPTKIIDEIILQPDGKFSIQNKEVQIESLKLKFKGYKDESNEFGVFLYGSSTNDGFRNKLIINGETFRVLIRSAEHESRIRSLIVEYQNKGINASFHENRFLK